MSPADAEWSRRAQELPTGALLTWGAGCMRARGLDRLARLVALRFGGWAMRAHRFAWVHGVRL